MTLSLKVTNDPTPAVFFGLLELDFDPVAERYAVLDRRDLSIRWQGPTPAVNPIKLILPAQFATQNNLLVMIFDDSGSPSYNMVGNDKVQAQLVDARNITTNP